MSPEKRLYPVSHRIPVYVALLVAALCLFALPAPSIADDESELPATERMISGAVEQNPREALLEAADDLASGASATPDSADPAAVNVESPAAEAPAVKNSLLKEINGRLFAILFYDLSRGSITIPKIDRDDMPVIDGTGKQEQLTVEIPLLIVVLLCGALFFTFWFRFINFRGFWHAVQIVRGRYDREEDEGEISHFRALTSALSATVGLGNIAGVAVAIQLGGPGAVFWMIVTALFGMSSKFSSCTLAQLYRRVNPDGSISGGPMYYIDIGLREKGAIWGALGKVLAVLYAFMVMGGAIGGGNMFQANQTVEAFRNTFGLPEKAAVVIGIIMAVLVGIVILGGIKRIGAATSKIVPFMCGLYVIASVIVIMGNLEAVPSALQLILTMAFTGNAFFGGMAGVLVKGVQRAAFSNEAGLGSAAIAHAAAKTDEPVREGLVAMLGPFIDTVIVCLMTSLVIIVTGAWSDPSITAEGTDIGVTLTSFAFSTVIPWFPFVLTVCIGLFAYSTMIAWCYYGERGWIYLLDHFGDSGLKTVILFRIVFVGCIVVGATHPLKDVLDFADAMILSMAFPNIVGSIILAPQVLEKVKDYWARYKSGAFEIN